MMVFDFDDLQHIPHLHEIPEQITRVKGYSSKGRTFERKVITVVTYLSFKLKVTRLVCMRKKRVEERKAIKENKAHVLL